MRCPRRNDKAVTRSNVLDVIADGEPKTAAFDECRLNMRMIVQRAFGSGFREPEGNHHQIRVIRQNLTC